MENSYKIRQYALLDAACVAASLNDILWKSLNAIREEQRPLMSVDELETSRKLADILVEESRTR